MQFSVFVFLILVNFFYSDLFTTASDVAQVHRTKSALACHSIDFVFVDRLLNVRVAGVTDFAVVSKMSIVCEYNRFVGLGFNVFVEYERTIGVDFEGPLYEALLVLGLGVYFKIFVARRLFFEIEFVGGSVAGLWRFNGERLIIGLGL